MSRPLPHAVVVAYGAPAALQRCLAALAGEVATTVVDNSSSSAVAAVAARCGARYIDAGANRGFAAAVNIALHDTAVVGGDVLLVNPDALVSPQAVRELARRLHGRRQRRIAALAPELHDAAGVPERVAWPFPSPWRMWAEAVGLGRLPARRQFVTGAVLLLRREALDQVGEFDERFFLYAEEADWQLRARKFGWRSVVCADVVAEHEGAGTSSDAGRRELLFHAGQETYIRKWYGAGGWWTYRTAACLGAAARALALRGERRAQAARRALLYLRGPRRAAAKLG